MSDLAELFKPNSRSPQGMQPTASILSAASQQTISSPVGSSAAPRAEWQLSSLEASLRKGVRREVPGDTMKEELRAFFTLQKEVFTRRAGIIGGIILLLWMFSDISGSNLFTLLLLVGTEMLTAQALPFSEPTLNTNIRRLQPLIYCTLFYSLLKWLNDVPTRQIDWPTTYLAVTATLVRSVIVFYDVFLAISTRAILASAVGQRKTLGKLLLFPKIVIYRARMLLSMGKHLIITSSMLVVLATGLFYSFNKLSFDCLQLDCLLKTLGVFLVLQLFLDFVWFVNISFSQNATSRVMRDKMPIYLSLLRLEYTPTNRLVQMECLKVLYVKLEQDSSFLTTDTYKSLLYSTVSHPLYSIWTCSINSQLPSWKEPHLTLPPSSLKPKSTIRSSQVKRHPCKTYWYTLERQQQSSVPSGRLSEHWNSWYPSPSSSSSSKK